MINITTNSLMPFLLALFILSSSCKRNSNEEIMGVIRPAKLIVVQERNDIQSSRFPATISSPRTSALSFSVSGLLTELAVNEAQRVTEGELIAKLDQRDFASKVSSTRSQFETARAEYERAERLAREDAIARNILEQRKAQMDTAQAQLDEAEKAMEDTELRAPFSGVISKIEVDQHQNVRDGQIVATMFAADTMEVIVNMPARMIAQSRSRTNMTAFILLDSAPTKPLSATFREASLDADPVSQTYEFTFSFIPPDDLIILPGMSATIKLSSMSHMAQERPPIHVPLGAVLSDGDGQYVWIVDKETMVVSKRLIKVEDSMGETVAVRDGLVSGETIIGAGAPHLVEGTVVRPWDD